MALKGSVNKNPSEMCEKKGVVVFSKKSFAPHIDNVLRIRGTDNSAFLSDELNQSTFRSLDQDHSEVKNINAEEQSYLKYTAVIDNMIKLSLKRAPVQIPGIKCGILEYPYAYVTHSIVHKDKLKGFS